MSDLCGCMMDVISEFNSEIEGSLAFFSLMLFLFLICSGNSLHVECILPFGMLCLSAWRMMFVKMHWRKSHTTTDLTACERIQIRLKLPHSIYGTKREKDR